MSDVFVSYKREDEARVGRLVRALEKHGLSIWWDRGLPGGEEWRRNIESNLDAAKCVVVVWTDASTGAEGRFVRDEASRGAARGVLVPVKMDRVQIPLGFGELQAIDLTRWRGRSSDPFLLDVAAAVLAKVAGRPPPPAKGPLKRLLRRLTFGSAVTTLVALGAALANNTLGVQDRLCRMSVGQPFMSDACGAMGLGSRPTRAERIAWSERALGSCEALKSHIDRFPKGVYRAEAIAMLAARRVTQTESWGPSKQVLTIFEGRDAPAAADESAAKIAAVARSQRLAERLCRDFSASGLYHYLAARVEPEEWNCARVTGGVVCGFDGRVVCSLEERHVLEEESCGEGRAP